VPTEFQAALKALAEAEAFIFLAASGQADKVSRQLDANYELATATDRDGHTALHAAAAAPGTGSVEVAETLLKKGANPSVQDVGGARLLDCSGLVAGVA
jgi:ankyrin repeat protein